MTDEEIRGYLQRNPDVLRHFLRREFRIGEKWLRDFLSCEARARRLP